ncbi:MAG: HipA domain-containing protein [Chlamydiia bacterium]|nr:HipA domain-containing protein [Chlamydiia bacterium]
MSLCVEAPTYTILHFQEADCEEPLGSKEKAWVSQGRTQWLFKYPRASGEHWAEKIACEVARRLGLPHAEVELATLQDERGVASKDILAKGESLIHGNELLAAQLPVYDIHKKWRQRQHTLANIWEAIELRVYFCEEAKSIFLGYLLLDALVGNSDRHHENWGFVRGPNCRYRLAQTYDHGSSLGRELTDHSRKQNCRQKILQLGTMEKYVCRARGSVFWVEGEEKAPTPVGLIVHAARDRRYCDYLEPWLDVIGRDFLEDILHEVDRVPEGWMSELARDFVKEMLSCTVKMLGGMLGRW